MMSHDKSDTTGVAPFVDAVEKDPSAKRISDFATSPPAKDISSIKAASDIFEAEDAEKAARENESEGQD